MECCMPVLKNHLVPLCRLEHTGRLVHDRFLSVLGKAQETKSWTLPVRLVKEEEMVTDCWYTLEVSQAPDLEIHAVKQRMDCWSIYLFEFCSLNPDVQNPAVSSIPSAREWDYLVVDSKKSIERTLEWDLVLQTASLIHPCLRLGLGRIVDWCSYRSLRRSVFCRPFSKRWRLTWPGVWLSKVLYTSIKPGVILLNFYRAVGEVREGLLLHNLRLITSYLQEDWIKVLGRFFLQNSTPLDRVWVEVQNLESLCFDWTSSQNLLDLEGGMAWFVGELVQ